MSKLLPIQVMWFFIIFTLVVQPAHGQRPILDEHGNPTGLINMNPDPDGEPWIAGGLSPLTEEEIAEFNRIPRFEIPEHLRGRQLPPTVDNSTKPQMRPIFNQIGGSCGQASGMGYHFSYERNLVLGTLPTTDDNICAYGFTWNFVNGGSGSGSWPSAGYNIAKEMGCGHKADFNGQDNGGSGTAWMNGYEGYYNANDCHIVRTVSFSKDDIDELKNWFYDKGTGTGENGGMVTFGASVSFSTTTISSGPYSGQKLATSLSSGSAHAMTLVGYSEEVSYDLNGDGRITNDVDVTRDGIIDYRDREEGAWQLVNSWGSSWNNSGKIWVMYSGFGGSNIVGIEAEPFETKLMIKATVTHNSRSSLTLTTGFSSDINANSPSETKGYSKAFNRAGGSYPMEGSGGSATLEIGLDVTEFYEEGMAQGKFFLIAESNSGTVESMSLMDYTSGQVVETKCDQTQVSISGTTYLSVVKVFSPLTLIKPSGGEEFVMSSTVDITWASIFTDPVSIYLLKGQNVVSTIGEDLPNNKKYSWKIPDNIDAGSDYRIRITGNGNTAESEAFTIKKKPSILVGTNEIVVKLAPSTSEDKSLKVSNEGEGELNYSVSSAGGSNIILINEIFAPHDEFFDGMELWNRGTDMDMTGWRVKWNDNNGTSGEYTFSSGFTFKSGSTVILTDEEGGTNDSTFYVGANLSWTIDPDQDKTELSIAVLDANGKGVDFVRSAGNTDDPPDGTEWNGDGIDLSSQRLYRKQNEDTDDASDWEGGSGESSVNEINPGQTMDGVGEYWLVYDPDNGTVDALSNIDIKLTFNSEGLENGDYYDTLKIVHDDPDNESPYPVYVKLIVGPTSIVDKVQYSSELSIVNANNGIYYHIPERMRNKDVSLKMYNIQGKVVKTLVKGRVESGMHRINFNSLQNPVAAGIYICRMEVGTFTKTLNVLVK